MEQSVRRRWSGVRIGTVRSAIDLAGALVHRSPQAVIYLAPQSPASVQRLTRLVQAIKPSCRVVVVSDQPWASVSEADLVIPPSQLDHLASRLDLHSGPEQAHAPESGAGSRSGPDLDMVLLEQVHECALWVDEQGYIRRARANASGLLGGKPSEVLEGTNFSALVHRDHCVQVAGFIHQLASSGAPRRITVLLGNQDLAYRWVEVRGVSLPQPEVAGLLLFLRDVTEALTLEHQLRESSRYHQALYDSIPSAALVVDLAGIRLANRAAVRLLRAKSPEDLLGKPLARIVEESHLLPLNRVLEGLAPDRPETLEVALVCLDGSLIHARISGSLLQINGRTQAILYLHDITHQKEQEAEIQNLVHSDPLTGLGNRRMLIEQGAQLIALSGRHGWSSALLYIDLDRFKIVNDTMGHMRGDELLRLVGQRILGTVRTSDVVCRIGGDEFAIILPDCREDYAQLVGERILRALEKPFYLVSQKIHLGASIGIALFGSHAQSLDVLLQQADVAMYQAKSKGGGVLVYHPSLNPYTPDRLILEGELHDALEQEQLVLHYQPVLNLRTGETREFEVLSRWPNPKRGLVPPAVFIPIAEETGLIRKLDRYVLNNAIQWLSIPGNEETSVSVNLSTKSFNDPELPLFVKEALAKSHVKPSNLILEVTESALAEPERALPVMQELKHLGLRIALDDFGTGYSSMAYLAQYPFDRLKIDGVFLRLVGKSVHSEALLKALVQLGRALGLEVQVEGVEDGRMLDFLREIGCDFAQGYFVGSPSLVEQFVRTRVNLDHEGQGLQGR